MIGLVTIPRPMLHGSIIRLRVSPRAISINIVALPINRIECSEMMMNKGTAPASP